MKWFRFYDEVVDDPKVQNLTAKLFKTWVSLLCLASRHGGKLPAAIKDVAFALRVSERQALSAIEAMMTAGLFEREGVTLVPHNWNGRQYKSDDSNERVKLLRERKRNVNVTASATPSETEAEQKQSRAEADAKALPPLALAQKVAAELCLSGPTIIAAVAGAIDFLVKHEGKSQNSAVEFLLAKCKDLIEAGGAPNKFWFDDRKWRIPGEPRATPEPARTETFWDYPRKNEQMAATVWADVKEGIRVQINPHSFETWLKPTQGGGIVGDTLYVRVPVKEFLHVEDKFGDIIHGKLPEAIKTVKFIAPVSRKAAAAG